MPHAEGGRVFPAPQGFCKAPCVQGCGCAGRGVAPSQPAGVPCWCMNGTSWHRGGGKEVERTHFLGRHYVIILWFALILFEEGILAIEIGISYCRVNTTVPKSL